MWKSRDKKSPTAPGLIEGADDVVDSSRRGARKVALFLSVLEPQTAERLLALFDPDVARMIADEARTVDCVSSDDLEKIVTEFLDSAGGVFDAQLADALVAQARSNVHRQSRSNTENFDQSQNEAALSDGSVAASGKLLTSLEAVAPETLAAMMAEERPAMIAAVASLLSEERRKEFMRLLSPDVRAFASRVSVKPETASSLALKRLEDVLFERAFDD